MVSWLVFSRHMLGNVGFKGHPLTLGRILHASSCVCADSGPKRLIEVKAYGVRCWTCAAFIGHCNLLRPEVKYSPLG